MVGPHLREACIGCLALSYQSQATLRLLHVHIVHHTLSFLVLLLLWHPSTWQRRPNIKSDLTCQPLCCSDSHVSYRNLIHKWVHLTFHSFLEPLLTHCRQHQFQQVKGGSLEMLRAFRHFRPAAVGRRLFMDYREFRESIKQKVRMARVRLSRRRALGVHETLLSFTSFPTLINCVARAGWGLLSACAATKSKGAEATSRRRGEARHEGMMTATHPSQKTSEAYDTRGTMKETNETEGGDHRVLSETTTRT